MRIGIDATSLPICPAGAGRYLCNLISNLAKVDANNEYFIFLKRRDFYHFSNLSGNFDLIGLPNFSRIPRIAWEMGRPKYFSKKMGLDVWHSPHYVAPFGFVNTRLVVTIHDLTFFLFPHLYSFSRRFSFQKFISQAVNRADALITVSQSTQNDLVRIFPQAEAKTTTIYSGIEPYPNNGYSIEQKSRTKNYLTDGYPYILFVGTLDRRKNIPLLISAFSELVQNKGVPHHLVLVGQPGNDLNRVRREIQSARLENRIHLTGYVNEKKLQSLYRGAELFVCPSMYEGFGFPVLEAMAYGIPVLCSDVGATAEIASWPGMRFEPGNKKQLVTKMAGALFDVRFREDLIQKGLARAGDFLWENTARETIALYEQVGVKRSYKTTIRSFHGSEKTGKNIPGSSYESPTGIREAILQTILFSDLFDYPLTLEEIHRDLIAYPASAKSIQKELESELLKKEIQFFDCYYFLKGRQNLVSLRLQKKDRTKKLLQKYRRTLRRICSFPFVKAVALTGTIAFENVNGNDDIDLVIIVDGRRTWITYLMLVLFLKVIGKRNIMCINYLEGYSRPTLPEQNFFTAHQIAHLCPISGNGEFVHYWQANNWIYDFLPHAGLTGVNDGFFNIQKSRVSKFLKMMLSNPFFDRLENFVYRNYSKRIRTITAELQNSRIWIDRQRIQLFTNDHQQRIMTKFNARLNSELTLQE